MGYKEKGKVLHLYKALYGLRKSPLLWQRHFKSSLIKIGFSIIPHKPYCIIKKGVLIFFILMILYLRSEKINRE